MNLMPLMLMMNNKNQKNMQIDQMIAQLNQMKSMEQLAKLPKEQQTGRMMAEFAKSNPQLSTLMPLLQSNGNQAQLLQSMMDKNGLTSLLSKGGQNSDMTAHASAASTQSVSTINTVTVNPLKPVAQIANKDITYLLNRYINR